MDALIRTKNIKLGAKLKKMINSNKVTRTRFS